MKHGNIIRMKWWFARSARWGATGADRSNNQYSVLQ